MMTKSKQKLIFVLSCLLALLCCTSCGYHMGSMMHPQIQSIAIAEVKSEQQEPLVIGHLRRELASQFQVDGSLKLKSKNDADCILYCRILNVKNRAVRMYSHDDEEGTYFPAEFSITVEAEFTVIIPGRSDPLIALRNVSGSANYSYNADPLVSRQNGLRQACYNMSREIVEYTTEAW